VALLAAGCGGSKDSSGESSAETLPNPTELPPQAVALVSHVPPAMGTITRTELDHAIALGSVQAGLDSSPSPGSSKYKKTEEVAMRELIEAIWLRGEAREMGVSVTNKQVQIELARVRKQDFNTSEAYKEFLASSHLSQQDVLDRVELQILTRRVQERIAGSVPSPSNSEISDFYDSAKTTQFTTAPTRDVRVVVNKSATKIAEAKSLLDQDDSAASWKRVTKEFSSDPVSKSNGGLTPGVTEDALKEPLKAVVFQSSPGEVIGPVDFEGKQLLIEVEKVNPGKIQPLPKARSQIRQQLIQQAEQEKTKEFLNAYKKRWRERTVCAPKYAIEECSNGPKPR
jgi:parvulin-like peptidyl-prolyl isomerase